MDHELDNDHADCRSGARVDADLSGDHPQRPVRLCVECHGRVISEGRSTPMVVRNISQGGVQIEATTWLALNQTVRLAIRGMPERFAQVRWRNRHDHGLAFTHAYRLEELAAHAPTLQPLASQPSPAATEFAGKLLAHAGA